MLVGGAFLLTPGVLTDVAGFSLLFPTTRRWLQRGARKRLERQIADGTVRVVTMGSWGIGGFDPTGGDAFGGPLGGDRVDPRSAPPGMDPSKQIVVDEE